MERREQLSIFGALRSNLPSPNGEKRAVILLGVLRSNPPSPNGEKRAVILLGVLRSNPPSPNGEGLGVRSKHLFQWQNKKTISLIT
jgi:hypothetical protein